LSIRRFAPEEFEAEVKTMTLAKSRRIAAPLQSMSLIFLITTMVA
jgi:hypothetical protein